MNMHSKSLIGTSTVDLSEATLPGTSLSASLLQELIYSRGPCGQEEEVRAVFERELRNICDDVTTDCSGNCIGIIKGKYSGNSRSSVRLLAHMDEVAMVIKRIDDDGKIILRPLGGLYPGIIGQGPIEILGDQERVSAVLSMGPIHISNESSLSEAMPPPHPWGGNKGLGWGCVYAFTGKSRDDLECLGIHAGTRVVIHQQRRQLQILGDFISSYFLDNRAGILVTLRAAALLRASGETPPGDRYFIGSVSEEESMHNSASLNRRLPGDISIAVDIGPVAKEFGTHLDERPIVTYRDKHRSYDMRLCRELVRCGKDLKIDLQSAVWESYHSDATESTRGTVLCFPTDNTHGFEIAHSRSLDNCSLLLANLLARDL